MKKRWLLPLSMLCVGIIIGNTLTLVANSAPDEVQISNAQYTKLTTAIVGLHKRLNVLEAFFRPKGTHSDKITDALPVEEEQALEEVETKLSQTQSEVTSLKSQLSVLQADANANREAIMQLHKRLMQLDSKS